MLPAETILAIAELAQGAADPKIIKVSHRKQIVYKPGGESYETELDPGPRSHILQSMDSVHVVVREFSKARVFVDHRSIEVVCDDDDRRDTFRMPLSVSEQFAALCNLGENALSQDEAIRLFFHTLRDCCDARLHHVFRRVDFVTNESGTRSKLKEKESLGSEIHATLSAAETIPESILVTIPVSQNAGLTSFRYPIELTIEVNHQHRKFLIAPAPGSIIAAANAFTEHVAELIAESLGEDRKPPLIGRLQE